MPVFEGDTQASHTSLPLGISYLMSTTSKLVNHESLPETRSLVLITEGILHTLADVCIGTEALLCFGHNDLTEKTSPITQPVGVVGVRRVQSKAPS